MITMVYQMLTVYEGVSLAFSMVLVNSLIHSRTGPVTVWGLLQLRQGLPLRRCTDFTHGALHCGGGTGPPAQRCEEPWA